MKDIPHCFMLALTVIVMRRTDGTGKERLFSVNADRLFGTLARRGAEVFGPPRAARE